MKCEECGFDYPPELLGPLMTSDGNFADLCGICALELGNRVLGVKREKFKGPLAEAMRQSAIKIREAKNDADKS